MLDSLRALISDNSKRDRFFVIVGQYYPPDSDEHRLIELAYQTAKDAFRDSVREGNGERYFEHLRAVALIVMVHLRVRDPKVVAAALLHDIIEDIKSWPYERVRKHFGHKVANLVWWVTKPNPDDFGGDKEARNRHYHHNLNRAPRKAIIIKLADRLHNLLTLWGVEEDKQRRKSRETQDFYLSLSEKHIILIHELESALREVSARWQPRSGSN
jgi:(p)ppGpp synthase/HD superfamily hydrolase